MKVYQAVEQWRGLASIGKKPRTKHYHAEIAGIIRKNWPDSGQAVATITPADVTAFVVRIAHYSAPRFNAVVSALKSFAPGASHLKRRPVKVKERAEINQLAFNRLLVECDKGERTHAGLIVRFLAHTGLRINEARQLRWTDVQPDCIYVPGQIAKNGKPRRIPFVNGIADVLARLRALDARPGLGFCLKRV